MEMGQLLRTLTVPPEDSGSIPRTHMVVYNYLTPGPGDSGLCQHQECTRHTNIHPGKTAIYINFFFFK